MKIKVETIVSEWIEGSGISYTETINCETYDAPEKTEVEFANNYKADWSWWEKEDREDGHDMLIKLNYYQEDADPMFDKPFFSAEEWESNIK